MRSTISLCTRYFFFARRFSSLNVPTMDEPTLIWDVIYRILDECIAIEIAQSEQLLDQATKHGCQSNELILINRQSRDYLLGHAGFHRLKVWYTLGKTTRRRDPVIVGVANPQRPNEWTMLHISLSNQRLLPDKQVCMFSLLEVRPPRRPVLQQKTTRRCWYRHDNVVMSGDGRVVPLLRYDRMINDIEAFATLNAASIWVWRSPSNAWLYRHLPTYRLLLDNSENELLIWRRHQKPFDRLSIGEQVLHHNVELFAGLATATPLL
ncbi:hypothetical protein BJV82DRAFT_637229 [Fennellomyces sp. T-0311]|nr:hypothetical protein BJV82DRAFT_637229 [Fennellomyces sp. T-0311]